MLLEGEPQRTHDPTRVAPSLDPSNQHGRPMPTYIKLVEGDTLTVLEDYRAVYEKLLAVAWQQPCEFTEEGEHGERPLTLNPSYVVFFRGV
jgi:hypothetical protein